VSSGIYREEHDAMRASIRALLERSADSAAVRRTIDSGTHDPLLWARMSDELGLPGMAVPEESGGSGFGVVECGAALEEIGRANLPSPLLTTTLAALALVHAGTADEILVSLATGKRLATVHLGPPTWRQDAGQVSGRLEHVADGATAEHLVLVGRDEAVVVDLEGPGVRRTPLRTMDLTRPQVRIELDAAPARPLDLPVGSVARLGALAAVLVACEQVGGAERMLERSTAYAVERVQFGRPIGSFQAVKHLLADMLVDLELARATQQHALALAADPTTDGTNLDAAARTARRSCSRAFLRVTSDAIRVHGGIGFTWEHDAHLYFRRARASAVLFAPTGDDERLAAAAGLAATGEAS
jgi:alkylation response protein AidB-like acyl-CoA dehydrogenase